MIQDPPMGPVGTRTVAVNAMWNLLGRIAPIAVALAVTPTLIRTLGPERWGMFTVVLALVGTFGIFDFGLGRALTRAVAERVDQTAQDPSLVLTGLVGATALGALSGCMIALLSGYWVRNGLAASPGLQREFQIAIYIFCASAPLVILNASLWGVLSAFQRFREANLLNVLIVPMYYVGPLLILQVWNSLIAVMLVLAACRLVISIAYSVLCLRVMPSLRGAKPAVAHLKPLLRFGGWMTISNLMFPTLLYIDRFVIASYFSVEAAGYFSTSLDLVTRLSIVPIAIMTTAYPAMASSFRADAENTATLFRHSMLAIAAIMFPACLIVTGYSDDLMTVWVGAEFARSAGPVLSWLGVGILMASADGVVAGLIDSIGRPEVNAKFSLIEILVYVPVLIFMLRNFGITGVAIAWTLRCCFDFIARLSLAERLYKPLASSIWRTAPVVLSGGVLLAAPRLTDNGPAHILLIVTFEIAFVFALWRLSLTEQERKRLCNRRLQVA